MPKRKMGNSTVESGVALVAGVGVGELGGTVGLAVEGSVAAGAMVLRSLLIRLGVGKAAAEGVPVAEAEVVVVVVVARRLA